jgi:mRNA-degrading endonuclease YafQ of YafQ-DinJ toxin-antitoxin module
MPRYVIRFTNQIKRDLRLMTKRDKDIKRFEAVVDSLSNRKSLPPKKIVTMLLPATDAAIGIVILSRIGC